MQQQHLSFARACGKGHLMAGSEAVRIVRGAVNQRLHLIRLGKGYLSAEQVRLPLMRLQRWLQTNLHPSPETLRALWQQQLGDDLRLIMPTHAAGTRALERFQQLTKTH